MTKKIFIVTVVVYDHADCNLWSCAKAFSDEAEAREFFNAEGRKCLAEARGEEEYDDPNDYYAVNEKVSEGRLAYYRLSNVPEHYEVKFYRQSVEA